MLVLRYKVTALHEHQRSYTYFADLTIFVARDCYVIVIALHVESANMCSYVDAQCSDLIPEN